MDRDKIVELAKKRAAANEYLRNLGMMNAWGRTHEETVARSAQYQMANDAAYAADVAYRDAIAGLSADELAAIATSPPPSAG
jgi:hypothetical protein